jgi:hypothetical protein
MSYTIPITLNRIRESQIGAQTEDEYSDNIVNAYGERVLASHDWTLNSNRINETNPLSEQYASDAFEETAIVAGASYYHYIDMGGYSHLTITGNNTNGTGGATQLITLEATCQDDGTAPGSIAASAWVDITQYGVDWLSGIAAVASAAGKFAWAIMDASRFKYVRIKYDILAGNNDASHEIYVRKTVL